LELLPGLLLTNEHNPLLKDLYGLSTNDCHHCYVWVISLFAKMHYVKDKLGRSRKGDNMPIDNLKDQMMTVSEVSSTLHVHPNTLRRWAHKGIIRSFRITPRGDRRFMFRDIDQFLQRMNNQNQQSTVQTAISSLNL